MKVLNAGEVTQRVEGRWDSANKHQGLMPKGVVLEPGETRPPQDAELWSVGHKLGPHPPQAWNGMSRQEKTESQPGFWRLVCLWAVLDPATRGSARITMVLSCLVRSHSDSNNLMDLWGGPIWLGPKCLESISISISMIEKKRS